MRYSIWVHLFACGLCEHDYIRTIRFEKIDLISHHFDYFIWSSVIPSQLKILQMMNSKAHDFRNGIRLCNNPKINVKRSCSEFQGSIFLEASTSQYPRHRNIIQEFLVKWDYLRISNTTGQHTNKPISITTCPCKPSRARLLSTGK